LTETADHERAALLAAYRSTRYHVDAPTGRATALLEGLNARLDRALEAARVETWAHITAYNPGFARPSLEENVAAQNALIAAVEALGHAWWPGCGESVDGAWREPALCVLDIERSVAMALGRRFAQLAIVWGRRGATAELIVLEPDAV
jgi:hypothetical protein